MKQYWVYLLRCRDGSYYVGVTSNIQARVEQHATGFFPDCYTFRRRPVVVVWSDVFSTPLEAIFAEKRLKGWSRPKKAALVRGDWRAIEALSRGTSSVVGASRGAVAATIVAHASTSSG